jgi:hypothetical protein
LIAAKFKKAVSRLALRLAGTQGPVNYAAAALPFGCTSAV